MAQSVCPSLLTPQELKVFPDVLFSDEELAEFDLLLPVDIPEVGTSAFFGEVGANFNSKSAVIYPSPCRI